MRVEIERRVAVVTQCHMGGDTGVKSSKTARQNIFDLRNDESDVLCLNRLEERNEEGRRSIDSNGELVEGELPHVTGDLGRILYL